MPLADESPPLFLLGDFEPNGTDRVVLLDSSISELADFWCTLGTSLGGCSSQLLDMVAFRGTGFGWESLPSKDLLGGLGDFLNTSEPEGCRGRSLTGFLVTGCIGGECIRGSTGFSGFSLSMESSLADLFRDDRLSAAELKPAKVLVVFNGTTGLLSFATS